MNDRILVTSEKSSLSILDEFGVCIIPQVLNEQECLSIKNGMISALEYITSENEISFHYNDSTTWKALNDFPSKRMIYHFPHCLAHSQYLWDVRCNQNVIERFTQIWGTHDLVVSFDGISFHLPPEINGKPFQKEADAWFHTDQSFLKKDLHCIQGQINSVDCKTGDATLCVLLGSHKLHARYGEEHHITIPKDWYLIGNDVTWFTEKGCEQLRIVAPKGSLILWDSRTIHYGSEPLKGRPVPNIRATVYVCYTPRSLCTPEVLGKKINYFENMKMTNHWPHNPVPFPEKVSHYRANPNYKPIAPPVIDPFYRHLIGYEHRSREESMEFIKKLHDERK